MVYTNLTVFAINLASDNVVFRKKNNSEYDYRININGLL